MGIGPRILLIDVETSGLLTRVFGLFNQNIGLNQIIEDWFILSYAAKWLGEDKIFYGDARSSLKSRKDKKLLKEIWQLVDEADIVMGHNLTGFDEGKINARMIQQGMDPYSPFEKIDTLKISRKHFGFTSNKMEYLSDKLCKVHKKSKHERFHGMELWNECLRGNKEAWEEMRDYNQKDILALEELFYILQPWAKLINFSKYYGGEWVCVCGSRDFIKKGFTLTETGRFQRYKCKQCKKPFRDNLNLLDKTTRKKMLRPLGR